jgi:hypothetical protein
MANLFDGISANVGDFSSANAARLALSIDAISQAERLDSRIVFYDTRNGGILEHCNVVWKAVSMTHTRRNGSLQTFVLGENGQVLIVEKERVRSCDIDRSLGNDRRGGPMRKIRAFGDAIVAVGMNRQVYFLDLSEKWVEISAPRTNGSPVTGFEAIVGIGLDDFICAGWRGEIWRRLKGVWIQFHSPTNVLISDMVVADGKIFGCGLAGLLLSGDSQTWRVVDQGTFDIDLFSVAYYRGRLFVASLYCVYELKDDKLYDVDYGIEPPGTAHTLCTVEEGMALIGAKDLYFLKDLSWRRLE